MATIFATGGSPLLLSVSLSPPLSSQAFLSYQSAAVKGNAEAQYQLARCYREGEGTTKDEKKAEAWYQKAADQGLVVALRALEVYFDNALEAKAEQGDAAAQYALGDCYLYGLGVAKDEKKAAEYFKKAADQGHFRAQHNLGICCFNGIGVDMDKKKALFWFQKAAWCEKAAKQGNVEAQK